MNNKLILRLIKNNIEEISNLIIHFQDEEDDLKNGFPSLESRLNSLNKDIEILKSNLSQDPIHTAPVKDSVLIDEKVIPSIQDEETQALTEEKTSYNNTNHTEIADDINERTNDKIELCGSTLNDKLHESRGNNLQEKIKQSKLVDIQSAIGINDQFLFIRELFDNKSDEYKSAINYINSEDDYTKIVSYFKQSHKWDNEDDSVIQFFDLIKRKFE